MIHPTAIIDPAAQVSSEVEIGPYCIVGANVSIDSGCVLQSHVVIEGHTTIGKDNTFFPFSAIGGKTQDLKYAGEPTALIIGNGNVFRENTTMNRGTTAEIPTRIGDENLFLAYAHVGHECTVGNHCILSNNATLGGHCNIGDHVIISGLSGVHQFCNIGDHAMIGGCTKVTQDAPPFMIVDGNPASVRGVNIIGLTRRGFSKESISALKTLYKKIFLNKKINLKEALQAFSTSPLLEEPHVSQLVQFIEKSSRGIIR